MPALAVLGVLVLSAVAPRWLPGASLVASCGYGYSYGYGPTPVVTGVSPNFGPAGGGTNVTITGSGFCNNSLGVFFGATSASSFVLNDDSHIAAVSPAHADGTVDVTVQNGAGTSPTSAADLFTFKPDSPGVYTARDPVRLLDTRSNGARLGAGGSLNLQIGGISVPASATAVILNVTATNTSAPSFFTVYPTGASKPLASNLNWVAGQTVPNLVSVGLGTNGSITIFNAAGSADVIVDLEGYFAPSSGGSAGQFAPLAPARITDTRTGSGKPNAGLHLGPGATLNVAVAGAGGVPASGADSAVLNVTVTNTTAASFITAYPTGTSRPLASNVNWIAGKTVPNRVVVKIGTGGKVSFFNASGTTDLIVDVNGYITDSSLSGSAFFSLTPSRIVDTRNGTGGFTGKVGPGATITVTVAGNGGVPGTGATIPPTAVILNVTVTGTTAPSFLTAWPSGTSQPLISDLNYVAGQTVPNLVVVKLGTGGAIKVFNSAGSTHVVIDVVGWFG